MKKGIDVSSEYDPEGNWVLVIRKQRGKLTLEEIRAAAMEWEEDYYGLVLRCMSDETMQYYDDDLKGDCAELYRIDDVLEAFGRIRAK